MTFAFAAERPHDAWFMPARRSENLLAISLAFKSGLRKVLFWGLYAIETFTSKAEGDGVNIARKEH